MVLRPGSTAEVSAVLRYADEQGLKIVPQGGNTGLVGGQIPQESGDEIVLSLGRLNKVRNVDPDGFTITVESGVVLEALQREAEKVDRLFPLSLGAQGSCQVGGNLSTNAGGTAVLAYGNSRDLVLGLEVVMANGDVWNGLRALRKDNTGYDLKQLFIGAEGTLGVITAATLKLFPSRRSWKPPSLVWRARKMRCSSFRSPRGRPDRFSPALRSCRVSALSSACATSMAPAIRCLAVIPGTC